VADQVKSVWSNLLSNAIKYTPEGGQIRVLLRRADSYLLGQISDTGIGIPDEAKSQLFNEFFRARNAKELNITGTGLGLAIVKQIVEGAGGNIWFESQVGRGTIFSFTLPI
jgi:signal transduction histidine kinase